MDVQPEWSLAYAGRGDENFAGLVAGDRIRDLRQDLDALGLAEASSPTATRDILDRWAELSPTLHSLAAAAHSGSWLPVAEVEFHAPIAPRQIFQAGANYRKHVVDLAVAHTELSGDRTIEQVRHDAEVTMDARKQGGQPYIFLGLPSAVTGPTSVVTLPGYSEKHDWELELAAVIGTTAFRVDAAHALDHVAGFTIANDLTTRDLVFRRDMPEIGADWFRAKNAPGFLPLGPVIVPAEFVGDPQQLQITLALNGKTMQDESTADMLFTVAEIIAAASQTTPLLPGDLVLTGSPAGNGAAWGRMLQDGDLMESTITG
ncbi:MAG: fumarylacetoacetate hydrolase family protein, partial [Pseudolysinimonas sp.]